LYYIISNASCWCYQLHPDCCIHFRWHNRSLAYIPGSIQLKQSWNSSSTRAWRFLCHPQHLSWYLFESDRPRWTYDRGNQNHPAVTFECWDWHQSKWPESIGWWGTGENIQTQLVMKWTWAASQSRWSTSFVFTSWSDGFTGRECKIRLNTTNPAEFVAI
jgi:hypothetical protein